MGLRKLNRAVKMFTVMLMGKMTAKIMRRSSKKMLGMKLRGRPRKKSADRLTINERRKGSRRKKSAK